MLLSFQIMYLLSNSVAPIIRNKKIVYSSSHPVFSVKKIELNWHDFLATQLLC